MNLNQPSVFNNSRINEQSSPLVNNQAVGMRLTIQQGSAGGTSVYSESFSITTNVYGLANLQIDTGATTDDFSTIDWANGPYFIETALDATGGTSYSVMGTSQLMSVPYALSAMTSGNGAGPVGAVGLQGVAGNDGADGAVGATGGYPVHTIGESYGGGIVFYVYDGGQHGLISSTVSQATSQPWNNGTYRFTCSTADG